MSEGLESVAAPEVQAKAEKLGWIPPTRYKGDPERFVDAEEYIERGETVLPIVKEQNKRLQAELASVRAEAQATAMALKQAQDAIAQIEERHSVETQKAVERARAQVKVQLAAASEADDHEGVAELTDQLTRLNAAETEAATKATVAAAPPKPFVPPPELREWNVENPWFGTNKRKTALALGVAQELRDNGETAIGRAFFDKVAAEVEKELRDGQEDLPSRVEGGRGSGEPSRTGGKRSYANLPADAKAACDADARQFVGPTKRYKTQDEWRKRYAEIYFEA